MSAAPAKFYSFNYLSTTITSFSSATKYINRILHIPFFTIRFDIGAYTCTLSLNAKAQDILNTSV